MRRLVAGSVVTGFVVLSSFTLVGGQSDPVTPPVQVRTTQGTLTNMIGEVDVPWEILEYIQMKYEGHAVTKADKITRGNSELYRLRVDRDDVATDYESIAVLFDMKWRLIGEEKYATPPPPPPPAVKTQERPKVESEKKPENPVVVPTETKPAEGGRGAGSDPVQEESSSNTEEPTETPTETTEPSSTEP